ncbi:MAG: YkgJ family cysteine cluster protein [Deltaproteobacteria bacterium]|nr:YkgJ family cysteine cluster protein [Deltaproteobacteria bacterium]
MQKLRLDVLNAIYCLYDDFSKGLTVACKRGCALCCTQNVTMTTLEGYRILQYLISTGQRDLLKVIRDTTARKRFKPVLSTNEFAALCLRGEDPPEESDNDSLGVACKFLLHDECLIYGQRPFGCRCFFSARQCAKEASAVVDPFLITVNTVFLQFIEHIDQGGLFGNMNDVLMFLEQHKHYETQMASDNTDDTIDIYDSPGLAQNKSIPALLIPPKHRERLQPIFKKLTELVNT